MEKEYLKAIARNILIKISNDLGWSLVPPLYEKWILQGLMEVNESEANSDIPDTLRADILSLLVDISNSRVGHLGESGKVYSPQLGVREIESLVQRLKT